MQDKTHTQALPNDTEDKEDYLLLSIFLALIRGLLHVWEQSAIIIIELNPVFQKISCLMMFGALSLRQSKKKGQYDTGDKRK